MRFLHTADLHLGKAFHGMPPDRTRERREDLKQVLRNIVLQANDHAVDLVILAGDVFDMPEPPAPLVDFVGFTLRPEAFHRRTTVLVVAGDQDSLRPESPWLTAEFPKNFSIVRAADWTEVRAVDGLRILAVSAAGDRRERNLLRELAGRLAESPDPTLVVAHASWESPGFQPAGFCPFAEEDLLPLRSRADYVALGQSHEVRQVSGHPLAYYPGAPEPIFPDQANMDACVLIGELTGKGAVSVKPVAVNVRNLRHIELDVTPFHRDLEVVDALRKLADRRSCLRLTLRGRPAVEYTPDADRIEEELATLFFSVEIVVAIDLPEPLEGSPGTVQGEFIREARRALAALLPDEAAEAEALRQALRYGVAALQGKEL